jgi:hypothetical protein
VLVCGAGYVLSVLCGPRDGVLPRLLRRPRHRVA